MADTVYCNGSLSIHLCQTGCCMNGTTNPCCQVTTNPHEASKLNLYSGYALCVLFVAIVCIVVYYCCRAYSCDFPCHLRLPSGKQRKYAISAELSTLSRQISDAELNLTYTVEDDPPPAYSDVINEEQINELPPYHMVFAIPQNDMIYCHL